MKFSENALKELQQEHQSLRIKYEEAVETIAAIQAGSIDAVMIQGPSGPQVFTLLGADYPYRILIETMSEGAVTISQRQDILYCNQRFAEMAELPVEKIIGNPVKEFISASSLQNFISIINEGLHTSKGEVKLKSSSGKEIQALLSYSLISLDDNSGCLIFTDLTEINKIRQELKTMNETLDQIVYKRTQELEEKNEELNREIQKRIAAEKVLKESEEKFMQVANAIPQLAWIADAEGYLTWYNDRWFEYTGTTFEQMKGWGWESVHSPEMLPLVLENWQYSIHTGIPFEMIFPLKGVDGIFREFLTRVIPVKNSEDKVLQWFGTNTDISEIRKIEKELQQSREKLTMALENGNTGIWEWNLETGKVYLDERVEKMFMLEPGSFGGSFGDIENLVIEEDLDYVRKAVQKSIENDLPMETLFRIGTLYGDTKYISAKALLKRDKDGTPVSMTGVAFDVTQMKKNTDQLLLKLNEELLRSNKELEQFAYVASHDLQEPLRMISSFTQLLSKRYSGQLDETAHEYIHYAVDGANRMYNLIQGLLAYSRIHTRGKDFTEVNMEKVMDQVKNNIRMQISEKQAEITVDQLPTIVADEAQMIQLMQNLLTNAIKFSKEKPKVHISSKTENEHYIFSIEDNGIGIEPQYFQRIFQIFQRLLPKEQYEGTGIGLSICKRIIERHEGKIWVDSELGKGSTFYFTIPRS